jgi:tetratricopeptide (TPR) repeat protein
MGKKQQAIQNYNIAQPLFESQQDTDGLISVYRNLAMAYTELGDRMRATNLVITAILLAKKVGDSQTIEDLETLRQAIDEYND